MSPHEYQELLKRVAGLPDHRKLKHRARALVGVALVAAVCGLAIIGCTAFIGRSVASDNIANAEAHAGHWVLLARYDLWWQLGGAIFCTLLQAVFAYLICHDIR